MKREQAVNRLQQNQAYLSEHYHIASLTLFGSVARDEGRADSDIDILVEFIQPVGLFLFIELKQRLEEILGCKVDLGTPRSLKPSIKDQVLREAIRVT
ncbi:MAG TPA: nucleotidyltransferase family protein [Anaerolinea sp.]|nr:nucleotidyltransferase family protein [Anaerolinea sp.]